MLTLNKRERWLSQQRARRRMALSPSLCSTVRCYEKQQMKDQAFRDIHNLDSFMSHLKVQNWYWSHLFYLPNDKNLPVSMISVISILIIRSKCLFQAYFIFSTTVLLIFTELNNFELVIMVLWCWVFLSNLNDLFMSDVGQGRKPRSFQSLH